MRYADIIDKVGVLFNHQQLMRRFPNEKVNTINRHMYRLVKTGDVFRIKNGAYKVHTAMVEKSLIGGIIEHPNAYISLETVLIMHNLLARETAKALRMKGIDQVDINVTHVANKQIKPYKFEGKNYKFSRIANDLFFGYKEKYEPRTGLKYYEADIEKAVLDYIYLRRPKVPDVITFPNSGSKFNLKKYFKYAEKFPAFVRNYPLF